MSGAGAATRGGAGAAEEPKGTGGGPASRGWDELWRIFHRVLEAETEEGARVLGDLEPELRREVEELLAAHHAGGSFLASAQDAAPADPMVGRQVGPYRVIRRLGRGGMGAVFLAEQTAPVHRRVALKMIRPELLDPSRAKPSSDQVLRRFEAERQALVLMNHPHVAAAYDVGSEHVDGQEVPWIAMEWVAGLPIDEFCDRYRLTLEERLSLLRQALLGVGHAHGKGIVHRDLKASNVLVTVRDGEAVAKVIDFGIAKALGPSLAPQPAVTRLGSSIGTPGAMSPEQAAGHGEVGPASDVYSLGLLGYRLLSGVGPGSADDGLPAPPPAQRFAALPEKQQKSIAGRRGLDPAALRRRLRGPLIPVILRALTLDPSGRYGHASAMLEALDTARRGSGRPRRSAVAAAAFALVVIVAAWVHFASPRGGPGDRPGGAGAEPEPQPTDSQNLIPVAVTFDDLPTSSGLSLEQAEAVTNSILRALEERSIPAAGFVNSSKVEVEGEEEERTELLRRWLDAGHVLGNHGARHLSLHRESVGDYLGDIEACEPLLRQLLGKNAKRWFRHPYLHTGLDTQTKGAVDAWLEDGGYTVAAVTLENLDWMFAAVYARQLGAGNDERAAEVGRAYLDFTATSLDFWEDISQRMFGRQHPHVLLLHTNRLNADYFGAVADLLKGRGYRFVGLEEAMADPVYALPADYAGPGGVLWQFRWAHSQGLEFDWRREPQPPQWIRDLFEG